MKRITVLWPTNSKEKFQLLLIPRLWKKWFIFVCLLFYQVKIGPLPSPLHSLFQAEPTVAVHFLKENHLLLGSSLGSLPCLVHLFSFRLIRLMLYFWWWYWDPRVGAWLWRRWLYFPKEHQLLQENSLSSLSCKLSS